MFSSFLIVQDPCLKCELREYERRKREELDKKYGNICPFRSIIFLNTLSLGIIEMNAIQCGEAVRTLLIGALHIISWQRV